MPQISKFPLQPSVHREVMKSFWWLIIHLTKEDEVVSFLGDFLSKTEKVMLAKRLAIALMVEKRYPFRDIRDTLKVSTSTVLRIQEVLDRSGQGYRIAIRKLAEKKQLDAFWKDVGKLIDFIAKGKRVFPRSRYR